MQKRVILIGYMGAGKTTIGAAYAGQEKLPLIDTDEEIVRRAGKTINEIFAEDGEPAFRAMETQVLQDLLDGEESFVLSVGGGLPMREENRKLLRRIGQVVYLRIRPETAAQRLAAATDRPLLRGRDLLARATEMIGVRGPVYEEAADIVIDGDGRTAEQVLAELTERIG